MEVKSEGRDALSITVKEVMQWESHLLSGQVQVTSTRPTIPEAVTKPAESTQKSVGGDLPEAGILEHPPRLFPFTSHLSLQHYPSPSPHPAKIPSSPKEDSEQGFLTQIAQSRASAG